jgi:hypothetical protein
MNLCDRCQLEPCLPANDYCAGCSPLIDAITRDPNVGYIQAVELAAYRPHDAAHAAKVKEFMEQFARRERIWKEAARDTERAIAYNAKVMDMIFSSLSR